jgi:hypothetical protein
VYTTHALELPLRLWGQSLVRVAHVEELCATASAWRQLPWVQCRVSTRYLAVAVICVPVCCTWTAATIGAAACIEDVNLLVDARARRGRCVRSDHTVAAAPDAILDGTEALDDTPQLCVVQLHAEPQAEDTMAIDRLPHQLLGLSIVHGRADRERAHFCAEPSRSKVAQLEWRCD